MLAKSTQRIWRARMRGGAAIVIMHGRSCMTMRPHIPTMSRPSTPDFHWIHRHRSQQSRSAVRCSASHTRLSYILLRTAFEVNFLAYGRQLRIKWFAYRCGHCQGQQWVYHESASWVHKCHVIRPFPLCGKRSSTPHTWSNSTANYRDRKNKKQKTKTETKTRYVQ